MTRIFRLAFLTGLLTVAFMVLPPVVRTTDAAACSCAGSPSASTDQSSCAACVTSCASSGGMSSYNLTAGTACTGDAVDPASAPAATPVVTTPAPAPAIAPADTYQCSAEASGLDLVKCHLLLFIAQILNIIASFLGRVLVFMVDIMMTFARYNDFGDAIVVQRGWVVVRDVVNMFFIVILLVSAFATIIGYDEASFHYKRVLPKLLLMAVLINFSRTIIQLGVDFSQVVMLTFVNAFANAGPGNLVSTLHLNQVLSMAPPTGSLSVDATAGGAAIEGTIDPVNIILALMLGIFLLSISLGVIIIMTGYLIFRIVGLWIALILSPLALFATALPGRLQKSMDAFTGKYWTRLSALLTGGPIMAFFLWLTFAITQSSTGEGGLAQAVNLQTSSPTATFLTSIGNSQDIASFIVGITLMLMGLDAAVSAASAVSETLGSYAKKVSGASQALGRLAATAPFLGAYYGGRAIDRRLDITGKAATAAFGLAAPVPILRSLVRKPLISAMGRNKRLDQAEAKEYQEGLEGLSTKQRAIAAFATPTGPLATKGQRAGYTQQMMERAGEKNAKAIKDEVLRSYQVKTAQQREKEIRAEHPDWDKKQIAKQMKDDDAMIKNRASQHADRDVASRQAFFLEKAKAYAEKNGDKDTVRNIEDQLKKNPQLALGGERDKLAKKLVSDPEAMKAMSSQAKGDMGVLYSLLEASESVQKDANGKVTGYDRAKLDAFMDKVGDKELKENLEMATKLTRDSSGKFGKKEMEQMVIGKNEKGKKRILDLPMNEAGKLAQNAAELERLFTIRPTGPEAILGSISSTQPVSSEAAKKAKADLQSAVGAHAIPTAATAAALAAAVNAAVDKLGFKDTADAAGPAGYTALINNVRTEVAAGKLDAISSAGKDIKGLSGQQQLDVVAAGQSADYIKKFIDNRGTRTKADNAAAQNIVEVAVSIRDDVKRSGYDSNPAVAAKQAEAVKLAAKVQEILNDPSDRVRKQLPGTWKVIVEEEKAH